MGTNQAERRSEEKVVLGYGSLRRRSQRRTKKKKKDQKNKQYLYMETIYNQYIDYLKNKGFEPTNLNKNNQSLEKHHILPLHDGGSVKGPVVLCTPKEHTLAHYYRYLAYGQKGDYVAFTMRWKQKMGLQERCLLAVEKNKRLKNLFWDSIWQSKQGKKRRWYFR